MLDAVRVVPGVLEATFDIPTETFIVRTKANESTDGVVAAIRGVGYVPSRVAEIPEQRQALAELPDTDSAAVKKAAAASKAEAKPLIIKFGGTFCRLCRVFEEQVLRDERVRSRLSEEFVFLEVDAAMDEAAARSFEVRGVPDFWFIGPEGNVVARENRYLDVRAFLQFLDRASGR